MLDFILGLRPTSGTSDAIAAAIERARTAQTEADARVTAARQERDAALLDADPRALATLEAKLSAARDGAAATAERVAAVLAQLEARLAAAKLAEMVAQVEAAKVKTEDAGRALVAWWNKHRDKLANLLREGERLDTAWGEAQFNWQNASRRATAEYPELVCAFPAPTGNAASDWQRDVAGMAQRPHVPHPPRQLDAQELEHEAEMERRRIEGQAAYQRNPPYDVSR